MGISTISQNPGAMVQRYIGTAYDNVRIVAENIEAIKELTGDNSITFKLIAAIYSVDENKVLNYPKENSQIILGNFYIYVRSGITELWEATGQVWVADPIEGKFKKLEIQGKDIRVFNSYSDFKLADTSEDSNVILLGFLEGDSRTNHLTKVNGIWLPQDGELDINENDLQVCDIKSDRYKIFTQAGGFEVWSLIEEAVSGKAGMGAYDINGNYDLDLRYNAFGDEYVKSKYLEYADYTQPNESDFDTGMENEVIPIRTLPINPPSKLGIGLIQPDTGNYFLSTNTKLNTDWRQI